MQYTEIDYFANHYNRYRFPWTLYHNGIKKALLNSLPREPSDVLNFGFGLFAELVYLPDYNRYYGIDIDKRAVDFVNNNWKGSFEKLYLSGEDDLCILKNRFDFVYALEVIEHNLEPMKFLLQMLSTLKPGRNMLLTTPNYGSFTYRFLENTILELIARGYGFTRKNLHPTKFTPNSLKELLQECDDIQGFKVKSISYNWVLTASIQKRSR